MSSPMERMLDSVRVLPSIPKALQEILLTLNKENTGTADVCVPLSTDPALTAKVLRMSNCAHFGHSRQIATVEEAVLMVGMSAVRTMVIASGLMGSFSDIPGFDMQRFWRLSLLSGNLARDIAHKTDVPAEEAYTAGLMHGLGILAIHGAFPEPASEIDKVCGDRSPCDRAELEFDQLGFHHGDVGAEIAQRWRLPEQIANALRYYAYPRRSGASDMAAVVHCAVAFAMDLVDEEPEDQWGHRIHPALSQRLHIEWDKVTDRASNYLAMRDMVNDMVS